MAARAFDLDSIVVDWGYAPPGELDDCGATHRVSTVGALRDLLLPSPAPTPLSGGSWAIRRSRSPHNPPLDD